MQHVRVLAPNISQSEAKLDSAQNDDFVVNKRRRFLDLSQESVDFAHMPKVRDMMSVKMYYRILLAVKTGGFSYRLSCILHVPVSANGNLSGSHQERCAGHCSHTEGGMIYFFDQDFCHVHQDFITRGIKTSGPISRNALFQSQQAGTVLSSAEVLDVRRISKHDTFRTSRYLHLVCSKVAAP